MNGIGLGLIAAMGNIAGGAIVMAASRSSRSKKQQEKDLHLLLHLGAGFMLAVVLLEMVPTALKTVNPAGLAAALILGGYLFIHLCETLIVPHTHGEKLLHGEPHNHPPNEALTPQTVYGALGGLIIHSAFDGIAIGSGAKLSTSLGWLLTVAILLHKIPVGATVSSLGLLAGLSRRRALLVPVALALATWVGTLIASVVPARALGISLCAAAGVTLYIAASDMVPHSRGASRGWQAAVMLLVGVGLFALTDFFLRSLGVA